MTRVVLGALALSVVLAGCGGDPEASPDPTATTSAVSTTPSTPPTPSAPALPDAAMANTKAGAIAFVRYYVEVINHAQITGELTSLRSLAADGCRPCARIRKELTRIYDAGGHIEGGRWAVLTTIAERSDEGRWLVVVSGRFAPSDLYETSDAQPKHSKGGRVLTNFLVQFESEWQVVRWWDAT